MPTDATLLSFPSPERPGAPGGAQPLVDGVAGPAARVRGLRAARPDPVHHCRHCGSPLTGDPARASGFCCAGCAYVHRLVHEHGLEGYYRIKDAVIAPADAAVFQPRDYVWLAELQARAEAGGVGEAAAAARARAPELILEVQGISCAGCVWLIERLFHQQPGALEIETDAQLGRVRFRWAAGRFDAVAFARVLQSFNYLLGPPGEEPAVPESRLLVRRVGLCAAFAMNVMLFALPSYFGMDEGFAYAPLFGTLAFVFATLSLLTGGLYFIGRALRALRDGVLHLDLPIAVGIIGAYAGSVQGWLSGRPDFVYFDFVATFILLMLTGRWAQVAAVERNRRRLLSGPARPHRVQVETPAGGVERPVEELATGETYLVRSGQVVPVESRLESAAATLGTAWINGEADPRECRVGAGVPAGSVNLGRATLRLRARQPWRASLLAQLLRPAARDPYRHRLFERVIGGYLAAILLVATLTALGWWLGTHDAARTWAAVTAVLVVSCPCALGLAYPLADELATVAARRFGVFVREHDLWPRLGRLRKFVFDKTGTLTLETPALRDPAALAALAPEARAALLALVRDNPHPVSQSLLENLLSAAPAGEAPPEALAGEVSEAVGHGLTLTTPAGRWTLGRPGWAGASRGDAPAERRAAPEPSAEAGAGAAERPRPEETAHDTELACDGVVVARFQFADEVRADAPQEIAALRAAGYAAYILSGDRPGKVAAMAAALGLPPGHAVAGVTPGEKAEWVRRLDARDTLMLGDGANDSLAFDAAFVRGTPVIHRGVLAGKADFYYLGRGLGGLRRLLEINATRRRTQAWLIVFSVTYNLVAVGLAAAGRMNPLVAAVLMPASSLVSLALVAAGLRRWVRV